MDGSLPGSSVRRILQARVLGWVATSFPGDLPNPGIEPGLPEFDLPPEPPGKSTGETQSSGSEICIWGLLPVLFFVK